ncbi:MAG TPA: ClpXP protease specificity-enhancing factor SspB [Thermoanaerobaculia bacterium]|nr:ClpXP protease specificity-enhancing factor SspB [Thermoanaerobaculia bacterium]
MDPDKIDYPALLQQAMRDVVRRVLEQVAEHGLPGEHHFHISFRTDAPGVELPRILHDQFPEEMTIILQNQFWDLEVTPEAFSVVLSFGGSRYRLTVPFDALVVFMDRPANFGVRFEPLPQAEESAQTPEETPVSVPGDPEEDSERGGVLRFDPSRKR